MRFEWGLLRGPAATCIVRRFGRVDAIPRSLETRNQNTPELVQNRSSSDCNRNGTTNTYTHSPTIDKDTFMSDKRQRGVVLRGLSLCTCETPFYCVPHALEYERNHVSSIAKHHFTFMLGSSRDALNLTLSHPESGGIHGLPVALSTTEARLRLFTSSTTWCAVA